MTLPRLDFLLGEELAQIGDDVTGLLADPQLSVAVTYQDFQSTTVNPGLGTDVRTYTDSSIRAIRNAVPSREVQASGGLYQMGDLRFMVARSDLPITPNSEDRLVDGALTYNLVSWDTDPLAKLWRLVARLVAA